MFNSLIRIFRENKEIKFTTKKRIACELLKLFINDLYLMGIGLVTNKDLHGNNAKIKITKDDAKDIKQITSHEQILGMEVLDFGKSSVNTVSNDTIEFTMKGGDIFKQLQQTFSDDETRCRRMIFADILSIVYGCELAYKHFTSGKLRKYLDYTFNKLSQLNHKFSQKYINENTYAETYKTTLDQLYDYVSLIILNA